MNEKYQTESVTQIKLISESNFEAHTCLFCGTKFFNRNDLELHSHLHNKSKSFTCLLCKEVFPELKLLKLHDLRHSLEEAHEEMSDVENWLTSLALSPCRVCGERFSCDEELVEHCVTNHKTLEHLNNGSVEVSIDDLSSDSCDSSGEEQINYPLLREEIITKKGVMHIRFTLIDHPNVQVGEFTRMVEHKIKTKKRSLKSDTKPKKFPKILDSKINTKKSNVKLGSSTKMSHEIIKREFNDRKKIPTLGLIPKKSFKAKISKPKSNSLSNDKKKKSSENEVLDVSSDSDVKIVFENQGKNVTGKSSRHSKLLALKKKIWKNNSNTSGPLKVCRFCQKSFISVEKYEHHLLSHKKYNCRKCFQVFLSAALLHRHSILHHIPGKRNSYQCKTCQEEFSSLIKLRAHKKTHSLNKVLQCPKCGRAFKNLHGMESHICRKIICKICKCQYPRRYSLSRHLRNVHKLEEVVVQKFLQVSSDEDEVSPKHQENDLEIKKSNQKTGLLIDKEKDKNSKKSVIEERNSVTNEKKGVSLTSDLSRASRKKENNSKVSLVKKQLPTKNIKPINAISSKPVKRQSLSNRKKTKSDIVSEDKVSESIKKTAKYSRQVKTKLSISKKSVKKTKASVPYQSKANFKRAVKKLVVNKGKKKTVSDSKKTLKKTKNLSTTSQKSKLRQKKMR